MLLSPLSQLFYRHSLMLLASSPLSLFENGVQTGLSTPSKCSCSAWSLAQSQGGTQRAGRSYGSVARLTREPGLFGAGSI